MGDYNGHVGLGVKCSKEVATAIRGAIILAKLSIIPVRLGYWGNKLGAPHTVPCKVGEIENYLGTPDFPFYISVNFYPSLINYLPTLVARLPVNVGVSWCVSSLPLVVLV